MFSTPHNLEQLQSALEQISTAKREAALAQRAGIDTSAQVAALNDNEAKLLALKQVYFPNS